MTIADEPARLIDNLRELTESDSIRWRNSARQNEIYGVVATGSVTLSMSVHGDDADAIVFSIRLRDSSGEEVEEWTSAELPEIRPRIAALYDHAVRLAHGADAQITAAKRSASENLGLVGMGLLSLPPSICDLTHLKSLQLQRNRISSMPSDIARLTRLSQLNISWNGLRSLPEAIGNLVSLQQLQAHHNQLTSLSDWLGQLTQLQTLEVSSNQLTSLPESLGQLTQLRTLTAYRNQLTSLPESLGQLTQLQTLAIFNNQLTALPEWLGRLTRLEELVSSGNRLTSLPESIGQLTRLRRLTASRNQLTALPESLGGLVQLQTLDLYDNQLTALPESLSQLTQLQTLDLSHNQLTALPESMGGLTQLRTLALSHNQLTALPEWLGQLPQLQTLELSGNELMWLPESLGQLENLKVLALLGNPLNPELAAAYEHGVREVKKYLRELAKEARKRFEAKLLILGDGNEGKTCISRALRELPFEDQPTTRGVDVEKWTFAHPDDPKDEEKEITLNIWDFEGQEINHQTHQFFLTTDSLYLLVFKCRDQFLLDRAEYWLDTIRARAPKARVAIVITECETRTPYVPEDRLQAEYGDLLGDDKWLFAVGCADKSGISELQNGLMRGAADLRFMGRDWPGSYERAESAIQKQADAEVPHIVRGQLHTIFADAGIDEESFDDVAVSMATLGVITQFPDCPDLSDFIVLRPQWITKAISEIMEDSKLADDKGEISLQRMQEIWADKEYEGLFATFHNCMKEFELCYDLEDPARRCLLPLRFGYIKPKIPWTSAENIKERRVNYKLNIRPPTGLMSRLIVKTHHMIVSTDDLPNGVYWHNGVFHRTGEGPLCSEALCEFDSEERTLSVTVRAAFPQNMIEQIHAYVKAVFSFFAGLEPVRSFGCIKVAGEAKTETQCHGLHSENKIAFAMESHEMVACEYGRHHIDPMQLIWGISSFGEYVIPSGDDSRRELDESRAWADTLSQDITRLLGWADQNNQLLEQVRRGQETLAPEIKQEMELKLREYLDYIGQMLDDREFPSAPGIISINTVDRSAWNPETYFKKKYVLTPFCECEQNIHPCEDGRVEFAKDREWWSKTAPWIARGTKVLSVGLQLAFTGMPLSMQPATLADIREDVALMNALAKHIELKVDDAHESVEGITGRFDDDSVTDMRRDHKDARLMRAALSRFLEEVAPDNYRARQWGSLRRVRMSDNSYRWLCEECATRAKG